MKKRCTWVSDDKLYQKYHDEEWGVPVFEDKKLFEALILEVFQSGLNWLVILKKRENFLQAFDNFEVEKVAKYNQEKIAELMENKGIIRNKLKIKATIQNAQSFIKIQKEFSSFSGYLWNFVDEKPIKNFWKNASEVPVETELSNEIAKDLKRRGFKFVGSVVIYSFMQAVGVVNDHFVDCFRYEEV